MENFNHKNKDFIAALGLDKDELFDVGKIGFEMHVMDGKSVSECIVEMVKQMKTNASNEIKVFAAGMIFSQLLTALKDKESSKILKRSIKDTSLPFNANDLIDSINGELDKDDK